MLNKIKEYISELGKDSAAISDQQQNDTEIINNACAALLIETALADKVFNEEELTSMKQTLQIVYKVGEKDIDELIDESKKKSFTIKQGINNSFIHRLCLFDKIF